MQKENLSLTQAEPSETMGRSGRTAQILVKELPGEGVTGRIGSEKGSRLVKQREDTDRVVYRLGTMQDLDAICTMIKDAIAEMERHDIYQWDETYPARCDFEEDIRNNNLFVASEEDALAAFYVISNECDEQYSNAKWQFGDPYCVLHRFCVSPEMQNRGRGKKVLAHIESQIKNMGYQSVRLDTFTGNPFAQRLYRHSGYESRGYADWRKGRFDLMEKKL